MAIGAYCDNCKHKELEHKFDKWPCMDCCDGDRRDPVRNADRIRAMSDEELAEWMANKVDCQYCSVRSAWCSESEASCRTNWLDWLRQNAEEGET